MALVNDDDYEKRLAADHSDGNQFMTQDAESVAVVQGLMKRINALEGFLVCYRIGTQPTEKQFQMMEDSAAAYGQADAWLIAQIDGPDVG